VLPARRSTVTLPRLKFDTLDFNLGTSPLVTDATVGAEPAVLGAILIRFTLSVNCVTVPVVERARPSGTLTDTRPPGAMSGTQTSLSGMSPGEFDSVSAGVGAGADAAELGASPEVPTLGWFGVGVAVTEPHP
jgi:hypothetical protein